MSRLLLTSGPSFGCLSLRCIRSTYTMRRVIETSDPSVKSAVAVELSLFPTKRGTNHRYVPSVPWYNISVLGGPLVRTRGYQCGRKIPRYVVYGGRSAILSRVPFGCYHPMRLQGGCPTTVSLKTFWIQCNKHYGVTSSYLWLCVLCPPLYLHELTTSLLLLLVHNCGYDITQSYMLRRTTRLLNSPIDVTCPGSAFSYKLVYET